jgi:hypothetical protein
VAGERDLDADGAGGAGDIADGRVATGVVTRAGGNGAGWIGGGTFAGADIPGFAVGAGN